MSTAEKIMELEEQIRYHSNLYFNQSAPEITDAEFDALVGELSSLAPDSVVLVEIGSVPSYGQKVTHSSMMGSLHKTRDTLKVEAWAKKYTSVAGIPVATVTPKMDGLAVRLNYEGGKLVEAAIRGNGEVGMNVTDNVRAMPNIPNSIPYKDTIEVRGEVFMPRSAFDIVNDRMRASGSRTFVNPRNAASGSLTCQDARVTASRMLDFTWYDIKGVEFNNEMERRSWAEKNLKGLNPVEIEIITVDHFGDVALKWEKKRPDLDYEIDGLVIALWETDDQEAAGWSGGCPLGKFAFKFKPEQKTSKVTGIDFQVGRTGKLTPVCRIEPTYIAGSTVRNLTLHNFGRVKELGVNVGDEILFEKAGDIIPHVVRVTEDSGNGTLEAPTNCPSCGEELEIGETHIICNNPACPAKLEERILHWLKRLEILGIGPSAVKALCASGLVCDIFDLYYLTPNNVSSCISGTSMPRKIVEVILEKNEIPLWQFLSALGVNNLGRTTSKLVAKEFKSLAALRESMDDNSCFSRLCTLDKIGDTVATDITNGLSHMWDTIDRVTECIDVLEVEDASGPLVGKTFLITGTLTSKRDDIVKMIESSGGSMKSSVSANLDYLVVGENPGSKLTKAKAKGIPVISEDQLRSMAQ